MKHLNRFKSILGFEQESNTQSRKKSVLCVLNGDQDIQQIT